MTFVHTQCKTIAESLISTNWWVVFGNFFFSTDQNWQTHFWWCGVDFHLNWAILAFTEESEERRSVSNMFDQLAEKFDGILPQSFDNKSKREHILMDFRWFQHKFKCSRLFFDFGKFDLFIEYIVISVYTLTNESHSHSRLCRLFGNWTKEILIANIYWRITSWYRLLHHLKHSFHTNNSIYS